MTKLLFALIAAAAGAATAFQSAANAGLASRIGLSAALVVNTSIVLLGTLIFYLYQWLARDLLSLRHAVVSLCRRPLRVSRNPFAGLRLSEDRRRGRDCDRRPRPRQLRRWRSIISA